MRCVVVAIELGVENMAGFDEFKLLPKGERNPVLAWLC
jgi:hypothetical protein